MKTIEIDSEVYKFLLGRVRDFGDTPNIVIRRELNLNDEHKTGVTASNSPIQEFLNSTEFRFERNAVGRFLAILSWLYKHHPDTFSVVEKIHGRGRLYFSKNVNDLEASGRSVNPKSIPNTPYWVITTTPTDLKQDILSQVMTALGCDPVTITIAKSAISH